MKEHLRWACTPAILCIVCITCVFSSVSIAKIGTTGASFDSAHPIWPANRETEKNLSVGFRAVFDCSEQQDPLLRVAGSSLYRVYLNGQFIGHGPARGPHGYYRVDEWSLGDCTTTGLCRSWGQKAWLRRDTVRKKQIRGSYRHSRLRNSGR